MVGKKRLSDPGRDISRASTTPSDWICVVEEPPSITILSFHQTQVTNLKLELCEQYLDLDIGTIDSMQGQE
jgi:hypothetical protein